MEKQEFKDINDDTRTTSLNIILMLLSCFSADIFPLYFRKSLLTVKKINFRISAVLGNMVKL